MKQITLDRLHVSGWDNNRVVDYSGIVLAYEKEQLIMPDILKQFFSSFAFLKIRYEKRPGEMEKHSFNPIYEFIYFHKSDFENMFSDYSIEGIVYPIGTAYDGNMTIYMHETGNFYLFVDGGPLIDIGTTIDSMLDCIIGDDVGKEIEPADI